MCGNPPHVGSMRVNAAPEAPGFDTFGAVTAPSFMLSEHLRYGTFTFNFELQQYIQAEIDAGQFVHALTLICDSPKHGVMSSLLNMLYTAHPEQVLCLGLGAGYAAVRAFCDANHISE